MKVFLALFIIVCFSCKNEKKPPQWGPVSGSVNDTTQKNDTLLSQLLSQPEARKSTEQIVNDVIKGAILDTFGLHLAPVKVTSARLFRPEYSNYKSISITFKNVSGKRVEAIKFKWYGIDAFGDPADMGTGSLVEGFGGGFDDDPLGIGKSRTSQWSILSRDGKKVVLAWAYEVAFSDGTRWELRPSY